MPIIRARSVQALPTNISRNLTFESFGDANGIFYHLGTFYGQHGWINPFTFEMVVITATFSFHTGHGILTNRQGGVSYYSPNAFNHSIVFDLGARNRLIPNFYTMQHDNENGYYLRSWKLEGSNNATSNRQADLDAASWAMLDNRVNDTSINSPEGWGGWAINSTIAYRWIRLTNTGLDSNGSRYLVLGEVELYGQLTRPSMSF